jgi:hypothetical protein
LTRSGAASITAPAAATGEEDSDLDPETLSDAGSELSAAEHVDGEVTPDGDLDPSDADSHEEAKTPPPGRYQCSRSGLAVCDL